MELFGLLEVARAMDAGREATVEPRQPLVKEIRLGFVIFEKTARISRGRQGEMESRQIFRIVCRALFAESILRPIGMSWRERVRERSQRPTQGLKPLGQQPRLTVADTAGGFGDSLRGKTHLDGGDWGVLPKPGFRLFLLRDDDPVGGLRFVVRPSRGWGRSGGSPPGDEAIGVLDRPFQVR